MPLAAILILVIYTLALSYITVYCLMQFDLLYRYVWFVDHAKKEGAPQPLPDSSLYNSAPKKLATAGMGDISAGSDLPAHGQNLEDSFPMVTIQLPVFNEKYVIERLIDHIAGLDYPIDRFEVQVLDDSTDETLEISRRKVAEYRSKGYQMEVFRRTKREGFKAGALRDALPGAKGEFVAIFDADFMPCPNFLRQTIPWFRNEKLAVVQTRWEHINEQYGLLTRLQAMQLNVHFSVEQTGRMAGGYLLQFNGTAGIWRKSAIEDAGGWQADTLTEDLDLSIRAQLKGWNIRYLQDVGSPAELPADMPSLKSQQFRWMKGGAETARKLLPSIWRSGLKLSAKFQATFHLLASSIFLFIMIAALSSVPLMYMLDDLSSAGINRHFFAWFLVGLLSIIAVYFTGNVTTDFRRGPRWKLFWRFLWRFPLFLSLSMGMALHNSWAVLQGYCGRPSPFVRTPKFALEEAGKGVSAGAYKVRPVGWITVLEGLMSVLFLSSMVAGIYWGNNTFLGFHLMLAFGFGAIFLYSVFPLRNR